MQDAVARDRETRPGKWVNELLERRQLQPEDVAVLVRKSSSTIFRWKKRGIDYLDWVGLLCLLGLPTDWKPGDPVKATTKPS